MLDEKNISWSSHDSIEEVIPSLDIIYMTRIQKERLDPSEYSNIKSHFILRSENLLQARENMKILHPLPRLDEITTDVDNTPYAYYFKQARNGLFTRQALLSLLLNNN